MMAAWRDAGGVCVLATVVGTRGSSYRSPGARMLILPDGSRIGAVSGGCLEGELCRRAHWWTSESPAVLKTFDTSTQEDNEGFGLGCGGGIDLLLERLPSRVDRDTSAAGAGARDGEPRGCGAGVGDRRERVFRASGGSAVCAGECAAVSGDSGTARACCGDGVFVQCGVT